MEEIRVLSPTAILGYGFPLESFKRGMEFRPHVLAVDPGSTDPGPYYLGAGVSFTDRQAVKRDLAIMLQAGREHNIPVIVGSAGGSGAKPHLDWCLEIVREIAQKNNLHFKMAVIGADLDKKVLREALGKGAIKALGPSEPLTLEELEVSKHTVAQMGVEPLSRLCRGEPR